MIPCEPARLQLFDVALPLSPITGNPYLDEFRLALAAYLAAQPDAPVRSLDEILEMESLVPGSPTSRIRC